MKDFLGFGGWALYFPRVDGVLVWMVSSCGWCQQSTTAPPLCFQHFGLFPVVKAALESIDLPVSRPSLSPLADDELVIYHRDASLS